MKKKINLTVPVSLIILIISACQTIPLSIEEDLSPIEYFQKGQEASNKRNWETALLYYRTFIDRFPEDSKKIVEAEFEMAFVYYKTGELEVAEEMFSAILEKYKQAGADILPAWPRILSEKLLLVVQEEFSRQVEETEAPAAE